MNAQYVADVGKEVTAEIIGQKVTAIRWMTEDELAEFGWEVGQRAVIIEFENGHCFTVVCDEEGNGPGALFTTLNGAAQVIAPI